MGRAPFYLVAFAAAGLTCGDADKAKNEFIAQFCDALRPCCSAVGLRSDSQFCRLTVGGSLPLAYDDRVGESCLSLVRSTSANPATCLANPVASEACKPVFAPNGPRGPGENCERDSDCMSPQGDVFCVSVVGPSGPTPRKCQAMLTGQLGDTPCENPADGVAATVFVCRASDGVRCEGNACVALSAAGGACTVTSDCVAEAYCEFGASCVMRKAVDTACVGADECLPGLHCSDATATCVPRVDIGAACTVSHECLSDNCDGTTCRPGLDNLALIVLCGEVTDG